MVDMTLPGLDKLPAPVKPHGEQEGRLQAGSGFNTSASRWYQITLKASFNPSAEQEPWLGETFAYRHHFHRSASILPWSRSSPS